MENNELNVVYSSDNNYAPHLGASVYSLLENNRSFSKIIIYIIDNGISSNNKNGLEKIVSGFSDAEIVWIPFSDWESKLKLDLAWDISVSTYARLFIGEMLPIHTNRVLYLDCDMIICGSLSVLWETNLCDCVIGAVQDDINDNTKRAVGLCPQDPYFNAGMLLIDLAKWRAQDIGKKAICFLDDHHGKVIHHDQGILNGILKGKWLKLPPAFNLMTIHYIFNGKQIKKFYQDHSDFYSDHEITLAKEKPVVIHFTPSFTTRPWVRNCVHPEKQRYWTAIGNTPWNHTAPERDPSKWYIRLINWRYRCFKV